MHEDLNNPERLSANKVSMALGVIFFTISSITSFMFFYENVPLLSQLVWFTGEMAWIGQALSGLVGVAVFDGAAVGWLYLILHGSDNNYQRSIAQVAFGAAIAGSSAASFAYLFLTGNSLFTLPEDFRNGLSIGSIFIVTVAIILNFVAKMAFSRNSDASREAERFNVRRGRIQAAEEQMATMLDRLIVDKTKAKLAAKAESMAEIRSDRLADQRERLEMGDDYNRQRTPLPTGRPRRQTVASMAADGEPVPQTRPRGDGENFQ